MAGSTQELWPSRHVATRARELGLRPCGTACAAQAAGSSALTAMAGRVDEVELELMAAAVTRR
jgi:hypothetical protein